MYRSILAHFYCLVLTFQVCKLLNYIFLLTFFIGFFLFDVSPFDVILNVLILKIPYVKMLNVQEIVQDCTML